MKTINPFLQAIEVKYIGPSNTRGSRYKATSASGLSITVHADDSLNIEENAYRAAKLNITGRAISSAEALKKGMYSFKYYNSRAERII